MFPVPYLILTALYSPIFLQLYRSRWEFIDYTHAYFILPVSLWLAWRQRKQIGTVPICFSTYPLFILILGLLMFLFGWRQDYLFISTLSLIPVLFGLTGYLYGPGTAKSLAFPILYLLLLVPPPLGILDALTIPMRYGVSLATAATLSLLRYPVARDGLLLSLGGHEIYMGAPCSGFRSLITMLALALPYAYVNTGSLRKKIILVASVIPLALLGNFIRVFSVCLVTYHMGEYIGTKFHDTSGFLIFLVLIAGLIQLDKRLK